LTKVDFSLTPYLEIPAGSEAKDTTLKSMLRLTRITQNSGKGLT
jgi:hypothetical protein